MPYPASTVAEDTYHDAVVNRVKLLPSSDVAALLGVSRQTLANWRCQGMGPAYLRLGPKGARVFYRLTEVEAWLNSQE